MRIETYIDNDGSSRNYYYAEDGELFTSKSKCEWYESWRSRDNHAKELIISCGDVPLASDPLECLYLVQIKGKKDLIDLAAYLNVPLDNLSVFYESFKEEMTIEPAHYFLLYSDEFADLLDVYEVYKDAHSFFENVSDCVNSIN